MCVLGASSVDRTIDTIKKEEKQQQKKNVSFATEMKGNWASRRGRAACGSHKRDALDP